MNKINKIGFVGIGNMGSQMAAHVMQAGFDLTVFDANAAVCAKFVAQHGGTVAASLAALGSGVEAVITLLPTDGIVNAVLLGAKA